MRSKDYGIKCELVWTASKQIAKALYYSNHKTNHKIYINATIPTKWKEFGSL